MSGYRYVKLNTMQGMLQLISADHKTMDWVINEIVKKYPVSKVYRGMEFTRIAISNENEKTIDAWVIQLMCKHGWEPYPGTGPINGVTWHHLRYRYDTHEF